MMKLNHFLLKLNLCKVSSVPVMLTFEINIDETLASSDSNKKSLITRGRQYMQVFKKMLNQVIKVDLETTFSDGYHAFCADTSGCR